MLHFVYIVGTNVANLALIVLPASNLIHLFIYFEDILNINIVPNQTRRPKELV